VCAPDGIKYITHASRLRRHSLTMLKWLFSGPATAAPPATNHRAGRSWMYDPELIGSELLAGCVEEGGSTDTDGDDDDPIRSFKSLNNIIFTMFGPGCDFMETEYNASQINIADFNVVVTVRSIWSTIFVFNHLCAKNQFGQAALTKRHEFLMQDFFHRMNVVTRGSFLALPDVFVLLTAPPDICLDRIRTRDRLEEQTVSLDNMKAQTARFNEFADWMRSNSVHVITVDTVEKTEDAVAAELAVMISDFTNASNFKRPLRFMIDGAVGVGKTVVAQILPMKVAVTIHMICIDEKVERWKSLRLLGAMLNPLEKNESSCIKDDATKMMPLPPSTMISPTAPTRPSVAVVGNIGSGKSTFLRALGNACPTFKVIYEPVEAWRESGMLGLFYEDKEKYACMFQMAAFVSRAELIENEVERCDPVLIPLMERCLESDRRVFAEQLRAEGMINNASWKTYTDMYNYLIKKVDSTAPKCLVYLDTDPQVCFERMQERGRPEETHITIEYLSALHMRHQQWLLDASGAANTHVLVINGNQAFHTNEALASSIADQVIYFSRELTTSS